MEFHQDDVTGQGRLKHAALIEKDKLEKLCRGVINMIARVSTGEKH